MPPPGFEQAISASEWLQTHTLDRANAAIGIGANSQLTTEKESTILIGIKNMTRPAVITI
jgi:hypothetical protein